MPEKHQFMLFSIGDARQEILELMKVLNIEVVSEKGAFKTIEFLAVPDSYEIDVLQQSYPECHLLDDTINGKDWEDYFSSID